MADNIACMIYDAHTGELKRIVVSDDAPDAAALAKTHVATAKGEASMEIPVIGVRNTPPKELQSMLNSLTGMTHEKQTPVDTPSPPTDKEREEAAAFEIVVRDRTG